MAAVYATVGFVLIQASDYVFRALLFPPWTHRALVVFVLAGFPVALVLAWAFEVTPEGVRRTRPAGGDDRPGGDARAAGPPGRRGPAVARWAALGLVVVVGVAAAVFLDVLPGGDGETTGSASGGEAPGSVAVLPFSDLSPEGDQRYFSDGVSEELLDALSRVEGLVVAGRTSSFQFREGETDVRAIGDSLGVAAVLDGSVSKEEDVVKVRARLVDTRDGYQLWSESYTRRLDDVFAIQEEIARAVARALEVRLGPEGDGRLSTAPTADFSAYDLYLKGRYHWNRRSVKAVRRSIELFREALDRDPRFAPAWAGLADAYVLLKSYGVIGPEEGAVRAREAAERALEIRELAEAHASLGAVTADYDWDFPRAEAHFRRALELDPNYSTALDWYAQLLADLGRTEDAVRFARRAQEVDPLRLLPSATEGEAYYLGRRFEEAVAKLERTLSRGPQLTAYLYLGLAYSQLGVHDRAVETLEEGRERYPGVSTFTGLLGYAYGRAGRRRDARRMLETLLDLRDERPVAAVDVAVVHLGLGNTEAALEWIERAFEERDWQMRFLGTEPAFDPLRSEPRFQAVLEKVRGASGRVDEAS